MQLTNLQKATVLKNRKKSLPLLIGMMFSGCTVVGLGSYSSLALGQQATDEVETIEITGTRIKKPGLISSSPILSVTEEEIRTSQPVAIEEFFKGLPGAIPAIGPSTNNGNGGGATIDLRGLGVNRTLILLNGRRLVPFDLTGRVDTNSVPIALVKQVDLVTGGASAVYGADAISGVVNFMLKDDFKGLDITTSTGWSEKNDAKRTRTDITMGAGLENGKGNVALSLGVTDTQPLNQNKRPIGLEALSSTTGLPQGSDTAVPAMFQVAAGTGVTTNPLAGTTQIDPATGKLVARYAPYNFNPPNLYVVPLDRMQASGLANYKINKHAEVYSQVFYTRSIVSTELAASGSFLNLYQVPIGNPYIPDAARAQLCEARGIPAANCVAGNTTEVPMAIGRRFTELGPRLGTFNNRSIQTYLGVKGEIIDKWSYDAYYSRGEVAASLTRGSWGSSSKLQQALRAVSKTACTNTANNCVPINVFGAEGTVTPEMANFINLNSIVNVSVEQSIFSGYVSGDLGSTVVSPFAKSPIGVAFGAEHRTVKASNQSDGSAQIQGEVLGTGAPTPDRAGTIKLKEFFGELLVPLVSDMPFVRSLDLDLGYRRTAFSTTGATQSYNSYKYGGDWEPVEGLRLRAMKQRATRAPNVNELYAPTVSGLSNVAVDPCQSTRINSAEANTAGTLSNLCRLTGVPIGQIGSLPAPSAGQINVLTGGTPTLTPEVADTKTYGFVVQPRILKGLTVSLDAYEIKINQAISSPSSTDILNQCYGTAFNPSFAMNAACSQVFRGPLGTFNGAEAKGVSTPTSNLGFQRTKGLDINVSYGFGFKDFGLDPKWGRVTLALNANKVSVWEVKPTPASILRDCLGYYSVACGNASSGGGNSPISKYKFSQRATWYVSDFDFSYNWRYFSGMKVEPLAGTFLPAFSSIPSYHYVDLAASWQVLKNVKLNLSVNNAFSKKPPNVGNTIGTTSVNSGNTFPQSYDVVGRYYTLGASIQF